MKHLIWLLLLVNTAFAAGPIGTIGNVPSVRLSGSSLVNISSDTQVKILGSYLGCGSATRRSTLRDPDGSAFQVAVGKKLYIYALKVSPGSTGSEGSFNLFYSDNDVGINTATAATSPVYYGNYSSTFIDQFNQNAGTGGTSLQGSREMDVGFNIPAQKYPGIECQTVGAGILNVTVIGIEK